MLIGDFAYVVEFGHSVNKLWVFSTIWVGGGDIRYWLEMTCFWFIMILCIMIYVGGWRGGDHS